MRIFVVVRFARLGRLGRGIKEDSEICSLLKSYILLTIDDVQNHQSTNLYLLEHGGRPLQARKALLSIDHVAHKTFGFC
jgi:hypothetical protein